MLHGSRAYYTNVDLSICNQCWEVETGGLGRGLSGWRAHCISMRTSACIPAPCKTWTSLWVPVNPAVGGWVGCWDMRIHVWWPSWAKGKAVTVWVQIVQSLDFVSCTLTRNKLPPKSAFLYTEYIDNKKEERVGEREVKACYTSPGNLGLIPHICHCNHVCALAHAHAHME